MKRTIYLLAVLPMLVCAEQAPAQTADGSAEQGAIVQVIADEKKAGREGEHYPYVDDLSATVEKMKKGEPTWLPK